MKIICITYVCLSTRVKGFSNEMIFKPLKDFNSDFAQPLEDFITLSDVNESRLILSGLLLDVMYIGVCVSLICIYVI